MDMDPFSLASTFMMQWGARHIQFDLTDAQKKLLSQPFARIFVLWAMFYVSTRNMRWTLLLVVTYIVVTQWLLNEKHPLNILPRKWLEQHGFVEPQKEHFSVYERYRNNLQLLAL